MEMGRVWKKCMRDGVGGRREAGTRSAFLLSYRGGEDKGRLRPKSRLEIDWRRSGRRAV